MDPNMVYASYDEQQQLLDENTSMNEQRYSDDADSECYVTKTTHTENIVQIPACGVLTLEDVMKEICTLKQLIHDLKEGTTSELCSLKATCVSMEACVKNLEMSAVTNLGNDSDIGRDQLVKDTFRTVDQTFSVEIPKVAGACGEVGVKGKGVIDGNGEITSSRNQDEALMHSTPFIPDVWLKAYNSVGVSNERNQSELCKSQGKRTSDSLNEGDNPAELENVTKKLFHTPSPRGRGQSSKYALAYAPKIGSKSRSCVSASTDRLSCGESSSKKGKHPASCIPKGAKLNFRLTNDMRLAHTEAKVCAYLFQKTNSPILMMENMVKVGDITATRAELLCLMPNRPITEKVLTLAAEKVRCAQKFELFQYVWCLPPTFVADIYNGLSLKEMDEKYCSRWMPVYEKLKFIYIPLSTVHGHWFLMIIDVEKGVIYHLDTYCSMDAADFRKMRMKKVGQVLHCLVNDPEYSMIFGNKRMDFMDMDIIEARGIPNTGRSDNSGVWLLDWIHMEHYFDPRNIYGTMKENVVRMNTAARLMLGVHNELRVTVQDNAEIYIKSLQITEPDGVDFDLDA